MEPDGSLWYSQVIFFNNNAFFHCLCSFDGKAWFLLFCHPL